MKKILIILLLIAFLTPAVAYAQSSDQSGVQGSGGGEAYNPDYNVLPIVLALIMLYLISYLLYDGKIIKKRRYKQIWSIVLIGSLIISGITGIILIFITDYGIMLNFSFLNLSLLFWHVEIGIILSVVLFFHIHIHWKKFKRILQTST